MKNSGISSSFVLGFFIALGLIVFGYELSESFLKAKSLERTVSVKGLAEEYVKAVKEYAAAKGSEVITLCAKIEEELVGLEDDEAEEFLQDLGVKESGLAKIIKTAFSKLNLISYFTAGVKEVRSWTIKRGWFAPKAASVIHNDFEKGFIRAEVISYEDFVKYGGEAGAKEAGKMRLEGKEYEVQDGDVMHFRFNV